MPSLTFLPSFFVFFASSRPTLNKITLRPHDPSSSKHSLCHHKGTRDPFCVLAYIAAMERWSQRPPSGSKQLISRREGKRFGRAHGSRGTRRKYWRRPPTSYGCDGPPGLCKSGCESRCGRSDKRAVWTDHPHPHPHRIPPPPRRWQHRGIILISMKSAL